MPRASTADQLPARLVTGFLQRWTVFILCVIIWQVATSIAKDTYFPTPLTIVRTMYHLWFAGPAEHLFLTDLAVHNILPSVGRLLAGWAAGGAIGILLGMFLGRSRTGMDYVGPLISFGRALPAPALLPLFLVLFKLGPPVQLATIAFGVVWPVLLNTIHGAQSIDQVQVDTARAFRISRPRWIFGVVLPAALPKIFSGLRISLALSLVLMVISELVGATDGIGYQFQVAIHSFDLTITWAWIVLLGILGNLLNWLFVTIEKRVLIWGRGGATEAR
ncbi:ABC transporter permease [Actinocrispum wychmicini]|uniref:ABC-type nitrate/sulfonate/bicarbonate transport system permease component n=1 Tax=Actinocrispum wychmicini TaxID=1213861 RepID=A0A4R2JUL0_9PSEU|nr:ABC transporter permease subunit [Actinocrispum wychmicini]TCO60719.1 ABC-type nitrate/sulfonate/bicarbonate transport system permease component [Actinocrispum wychmicini]